MRRVIRSVLLAMLVTAASFSLPNRSLEAQTATETEEQGPEAFVPSERLPADSAVSFPIDI